MIGKNRDNFFLKNKSHDIPWIVMDDITIGTCYFPDELPVTVNVTFVKGKIHLIEFIG